MSLGRPRLVDVSDPLSVLRAVVGILLIAATLGALVLVLVGVGARALLLVGLLWGLYGMFFAVVDGVLEPLIDLGGRILMDIGVVRQPRGFSDIETMVAQGHLALAADSYARRAREDGSVDALLRQADLLAGPMNDPAAAAQILEEFRHRGGGALPSRDDIRIGLALADLHERRLGDPGRALVEFRRLLDRHPAAIRRRQIREHLQQLKRRYFGAEVTP